MKNYKQLSLSLVAMVAASSLFAAEGACNYFVYMTRGTETTTSNNIFATVDSVSKNGLTFTERFISGQADDYVGGTANANTITQLEALGAVDTTTGYNSDTAVQAMYHANDDTTKDRGEIYLHIGYFYNGYTGAGSTVNDLVLNGNLTLARLALENQKDASTPTPGMLTTLTSGDTGSLLTLKCATSANENIFLRGAQGSTFILDTDILVANTAAATLNHSILVAGGAGTPNYVQFGTENGTKRTITFNNLGMKASTGAGITVSDGATLLSYSNIVLNDLKTMRLFNLAGNGSTATIKGNVTVTTAGETFRLFNVVANTTLNIDGNVTIAATADKTSTTFMGNVAKGGVVNFSGTITNNRNAETALNVGSITGGVASAGIANFRGTSTNLFAQFGLRYGTLNLLKTSGKAISFATGYVNGRTFGVGGNAFINVFGGNQLDLSECNLTLWGPDNKNLSFTLNLNGTNAEVKRITLSTANRYMVVDFGMTDSNMTNAEMTAQGITSDMIFATGEGKMQTFKVGSAGFSVADVAGNYVLFKNYIIGEDTVFSSVQLSSKGWYSDSTLDSNLFRFEVADSSLVYGKDNDYYFSETAVDGGWEYALVIVPEPSEVAALFGLLALGFALYFRKRN